MKVNDLIFAVMHLFNCEGGHLFHLSENKTNYYRGKYYTHRALIEGYEEARILDGDQYTLLELIKDEKWQATVVYDYGDNWNFRVKVESIEEVEIIPRNIPKIVNGVGYGIIEDCGGPAGLDDMAKDEDIDLRSFEITCRIAPGIKHLRSLYERSD
jgi:hypothetical protein